jgi:hypothetical protein
MLQILSAGRVIRLNINFRRSFSGHFRLSLVHWSPDRLRPVHTHGVRRLVGLLTSQFVRSALFPRRIVEERYVSIFAGEAERWWDVRWRGGFEPSRVSNAFTVLRLPGSEEKGKEGSIWNRQHQRLYILISKSNISMKCILNVSYSHYHSITLTLK